MFFFEGDLCVYLCDWLLGECLKSLVGIIKSNFVRKKTGQE